MKRKTYNQLTDECFGVSDKLKFDLEDGSKVLARFLNHFYSEDTKYINYLESKVNSTGDFTDTLLKENKDLREQLSKTLDDLEHVRTNLLKAHDKIDQFGKSTSDLKSVFIGEHYFTTEQVIINDNDEEMEIPVRHTVPWTLQKQIFKEMCEYIKNRKDEDIRP